MTNKPTPIVPVNTKLSVEERERLEQVRTKEWSIPKILMLGVQTLERIKKK